MQENYQIQTIRKTLNLTQQQLAESIGVSKQYLSRVENGLTELSKEKATLLCKTYGISFDWYFAGYGQMLLEDEDYTDRLFCGSNDIKRFANLIDIYNLYLKKVFEVVDKKYPEAIIEDKIKTAQILYMQDCLNDNFAISQVESIKKNIEEDFDSKFSSKILGTYYFLIVQKQENKE